MSEENYVSHLAKVLNHRLNQRFQNLLPDTSHWISGPSLSESPILDLLNCPEKHERDRLTEQWRDHKLKELNFVGVVVRLAISRV